MAKQPKKKAGKSILEKRRLKQEKRAATAPARKRKDAIRAGY